MTLFVGNTHSTMGEGGHQMVPKKVLCTLFATFHKLEMIQEKIKSKRFISAVAKAVTLSLSH